MVLKPVDEINPGYPGFQPGKKRLDSWFIFFKGKISLPGCLLLLLSFNPVSAENLNRVQETDFQVVQFVPPPKNQQPLPICKGRAPIDPAPCAGEMAPPRPDSPDHPGPVKLYKIVSLSDYYANAKSFLGMRIRMSGTLARNPDVTLADEGYYIFQEKPANESGNLFGCPLVGDIGGFSEGRSVEVEGIVVRKTGEVEEGSSRGAFLALEIENIFASAIREK